MAIINFQFDHQDLLVMMHDAAVSLQMRDKQVSTMRCRSLISSTGSGYTPPQSIFDAKSSSHIVLSRGYTQQHLTQRIAIFTEKIQSDP